MVQLNQSTAAILEPSTAAILEGNPLPSHFGHGTMVAGLIHLFAPSAKIMPLKAFNADGTADVSDKSRLSGKDARSHCRGMCLRY